MPVKQVYGKRTKTTSSCAKFLSPDKDELLQNTHNSNNERTKDSRAHKGAAMVAEVELQLEALSLQEPIVINEQDANTKKGGGRVRKPLKRRDVNVETQQEEKGRSEEAAVEANTKGQDTKAGTKELAAQPLRRSPRKHRTLKETEASTKDVAPDYLPKVQSDSRNADVREPEVRHDENHDAMPRAPRTPIRKGRGRPKKKLSPSPRPTRQLLTPEPSPDPDDVYSAYVKPLLDVSDRRKIISFEQWSSELDPYFDVTKIAEASFSEVFRLKVKSAVPGIGQEESVLKLIALRTPPNAPLQPSGKTSARTRGRTDTTQQQMRDLAAREEKDAWKSHVEDVLGEVRLLQNLNHIPGFTNFRELALVQGRPTASFGHAWQAWNRARPRGKKSLFPDPTKKASYEDTQLWAVVEMQDAGTDCEKVMEQGGISTIWEIWDVFWGVCLSVAKAEEGCRFEHRDLHLENVCIRSSRSDGNLTQPIVTKPLSKRLGFTGLETTVIDYTLSRADVVDASLLSSRHRRSATSSESGDEKETDVAYLDLDKDMGLFQGDAEVEYQYEIYRYMRSAVLYNDPLRQDEGLLDPPPSDLKSPRKPDTGPEKRNAGAGEGSIWHAFHPKTNLLWTHFLLTKLLQNLPSTNEPANMTPDSIMENVHLHTSSSSHPKPKYSDEEARLVLKKATRLHKILQKVELMLEPVVLGREECLGSVKELVVLALEMRWLRAEDVIGEVEES